MSRIFRGARPAVPLHSSACDFVGFSAVGMNAPFVVCTVPSPGSHRIGALAMESRPHFSGLGVRRRDVLDRQRVRGHFRDLVEAPEP
jgi:hypothetical protein